MIFILTVFVKYYLYINIKIFSIHPGLGWVKLIVWIVSPTHPYFGPAFSFFIYELSAFSFFILLCYVLDSEHLMLEHENTCVGSITFTNWAWGMQKVEFVMLRHAMLRQHASRADLCSLLIMKCKRVSLFLACMLCTWFHFNLKMLTVYLTMNWELSITLP